METKEKLKIANEGGSFDEKNSTWIGKSIRKGEKKGKVVRDQNGRFRILTVEFEDETREEIVLNNIGVDDERVHQYEWLSSGKWCDKWYRF